MNDRILERMEHKSDLKLRLHQAQETQDTEAIKALTADMAKAESDLRDAIQEYRHSVMWTADNGHPQHKAMLHRYLATMAQGKRLSGAEAELNQEFNLGDDIVPLAALEDRADVATTAPTDVPRLGSGGIVPRIFSRSDTVYMGATMPSVPHGTAVYTVLTGGSVGAPQAEAGTIESAAATWTTKTVSPVRLTARYLYNVEGAALLDGMENALRSDLRSVLSDTLDEQVINGSGTAPEFSGIRSELTATAAAGSGVTGWDGLIQIATDGIDGKYAYELSDVRLLVGVQTHKLLHTTFRATVPQNVSQFYALQGVTARASARMNKKASKKQGALRRVGNLAGETVVPVWDGLQIIRDPYSGAASGQIALTAIMLYSMAVLRTDSYAEIAVQVDA